MKTLIVVGFIALVIGGFTCGSYNGAMNADQAVQAQLGNLDAAYQRRTDLVPNLVKTVQAAGQFEKSTFTEIAEARSKAGQLHLTAADLNDPIKIKAFETAQASLSSSLGRLLAVAENYPTLQATAGYRDLMSQLEGTENRIQTERHKLNGAVQSYNTTVLSFPTRWIIGAAYPQRASFQATDSARTAPVIDFGSKP